MTAWFDIVDLIENNPITKLSTTYQNKLLTKIKTKFTENEQQIFVASFYGFLNYDSKMDFVIDLDDVWKWVGFSSKANSKHLLEKQFIIDKDYKLLLTKLPEQRLHPKGGQAYQTAGGVPKSGLVINKAGKIVSKAKSVEGHKNNKFETLQVSCDWWHFIETDPSVHERFLNNYKWCNYWDDVVIEMMY